MIAMLLAALLGQALVGPATPVRAPAPAMHKASASMAHVTLDPALESCLAGQKEEDDPQVYVTHCYQDAFDRANAALDAGFAGLAAKPALAADVADANAHWHTYRDAWCRIEKAGEPDEPSRGLTELQCRTEISQRLLTRMTDAWQQ